MTGVERPLPFAPPVLDWLAARGCEHAQWCDAATDRDPASPGDFFPMGHLPGRTGALGLQLGFRDGTALSRDEHRQLARYLRALRPFFGGDPPRTESAAVLTRNELVQLEHRLRNHLNSMLMTAAALGLQCQPPGHADDYLDQMDVEVQGCLALLRRLAGQADPPAQRLSAAGGGPG